MIRGTRMRRPGTSFSGAGHSGDAEHSLTASVVHDNDYGASKKPGSTNRRNYDGWKDYAAAFHLGSLGSEVDKDIDAAKC